MSKLMLYDAWDVVREPFPQSNILAGQTDSLAISIRLDYAEEYEEKLQSLEETFDFSNLENSKLHSLANKNKPGCLKIVDHYIKEFISLRPGASSYQSVCSTCLGKETRGCENCQVASVGVQKATGVPKSIKRSATHAKYREFLDQLTGKTFDYIAQKTVNGETVLETVKKHAFSTLNMHRYQFPDGTSLPFGHLI